MMRSSCGSPSAVHQSPAIAGAASAPRPIEPEATGVTATRSLGIAQPASNNAPSEVMPMTVRFISTIRFCFGGFHAIEQSAQGVDQPRDLLAVEIAQDMVPHVDHPTREIREDRKST